jgi:hypothetical protein
VELTAAASRAAVEGPPVAPLEPAAPAIDRSPVAQTLDVETVAGREVAEAPVVLPEAAGAHVDTRELSADHVARLEGPVATVVGAAVRYRVVSLALVRASLETAIDHALGMSRARTLTECVKLSSGLARRQRLFAVRQAGAFRSFARAAAQFDP